MSENTVIIQTPTCMVCSRPAFVVVPENEAIAYRNGADAQVAFRSLDISQRELIITGTHEHCWETIFGSLDDQ